MGQMDAHNKKGWDGPEPDTAKAIDIAQLLREVDEMLERSHFSKEPPTLAEASPVCLSHSATTVSRQDKTGQGSVAGAEPPAAAEKEPAVSRERTAFAAQAVPAKDFPVPAQPEEGEEARKEKYKVYVLPAEMQPTPQLLKQLKPLAVMEGAEPDWFSNLPLPPPPAQLEEGKADSGEKPRPKKKLRISIGNVAFYLGLVLLVLCVFLFKSSMGQAHASFAGFSMMHVLTGSMEKEIPKGSLIITKQVNAAELEIGDDITYLSGPTTTITHRIVGITENYADTGQRAFTTQGVMNSAPDAQPVPAANVVGKVIFHNYALGRILQFIQGNWAVLLVLLILTVGLIVALKHVFQKEPEQEKNNS